MIRRIKLTNFQSHEDTDISFESGLNVLVGQSDSGKTAILRALRWVFWNRPGGDEFRSHWGGDTHVVVELTDGNVITREKGKAGRNAYILNGKEYVAFGQDVPEDIARVINITDVNLQQQMDSPFLLSETPGEVAKHFNKVANLDIIDHATSYINKKLNAVQSDIKHHEKNVEKLETDLESLPDIEAYEKQVQYLEELERARIVGEQSVRAMKSVMRDIAHIEARKVVVRKSTRGAEQVERLLPLYQERSVLVGRRIALARLLQQHRTVRTRIQELAKVTERPATVIDTLLVLYAQKRKEGDRARNLRNMCKRIHEVEIMQENARKQVEVLEKEWHAEFPDTCPLCGTNNLKK
jgi:DNA repair protein SbcC/Rad50